MCVCVCGTSSGRAAHTCTSKALCHYAHAHELFKRATGKGRGWGGGELASVAVVVSESTPSVSHHITHINAHINTSAHT